jgi:hypothetical protein
MFPALRNNLKGSDGIPGGEGQDDHGLACGKVEGLFWQSRILHVALGRLPLLEVVDRGREVEEVCPWIVLRSLDYSPIHLNLQLLVNNGEERELSCEVAIFWGDRDSVREREWRQQSRL